MSVKMCSMALFCSGFFNLREQNINE